MRQIIEGTISVRRRDVFRMATISLWLLYSLRELHDLGGHMGQFRRAVAISSFGMALLLASGGVASAAGPSVVGMTYDKAKAAVSNAGLTADISTVVGSVLQQGDCIVVNQVLPPRTQRPVHNDAFVVELQRCRRDCHPGW